MKTQLLLVLLCFMPLPLRALTLEWDPPERTNGLTGYRVYVDGALSLSLGLQTRAVLPAQASGSHRAHVTSIDDAGAESSASNIVTWEVPQDLPPPTSPVWVGHSMSYTNGHWNLRIEWAPVPTARQYMVTLQNPLASSTSSIPVYVSVIDPFVVLPNLGPGTYSATVRASNSAGFSSPSNVLSVYIGLPGPPRSVRIIIQ